MSTAEKSSSQATVTSKRVSIASQMKNKMINNTKEVLPDCQTLLDSSLNSSFNPTCMESKDFVETENDFYGLPSVVKNLLETHRGITELYDWQKECLNLAISKEKTNIVYSLPTSGGKTLVAEILIFREIIRRKKNVIMVLPYISIVQEKVRVLSPFALDLDFNIEEYAGMKGQLPPRRRQNRHSLFVATIEKANLLINSLFENQRIEEIGLFVVDELHMLCEGGNRGAILETTLTKLKCYAKHVQVVGMSATFSNMADILSFLNAESYVGNFRPVQLKEFVKVGDELFSIDYQHKLKTFNLVGNGKLNFKYSSKMKLNDPEYLVGLLSEVIPKKSCLIFCPTKKHCESVSIFLSTHIPRNAFLKHLRGEKMSLLKALMEEGNGKICPVLEKTIPFGLAYHHSGLTMEERRLIEEAYTVGTLCCLSCTSTLAAGINLPAKRVIIRAPFVGLSQLTGTQYKQMVGRAGRAGFDDTTTGESILMLKTSETRLLNNLLCDDASSRNQGTSTLFENSGNTLLILILSLIGLKLATTVREVKRFVSATLYAQQIPIEDVLVESENAIAALKKAGLLKIETESDFLSVSKLGQATFKSGVDVTLSERLYKDLFDGLKSLVLINYLHLLFLVVPYDSLTMISVQSDIYFNIYMSLSVDEQNTLNVIGVPESYIVNLASGRKSKFVNDQTAHRCYLTLVLYDLWRGQNVWQVSKRFRIDRGTICTLLNRTASFASCVARFCEEMQIFWPYAALLPSFTKTLYYCCSAELIPLMELPAVKQGRARQFFNAGYKTLLDIAKARPIEMVNSVEHLPINIAKQIISAAKILLLEKAEALREEATDIMEGVI